MDINFRAEVEMEETVYALGYELILKQMNGKRLSDNELSFINFIYSRIDKQISRILSEIVT